MKRRLIALLAAAALTALTVAPALADGGIIWGS